MNQALVNQAPLLRAMEPPDARPCAWIDAASQFASWNEVLFLESFQPGYHAWVLEEAGKVIGFMVFCHVLDEASLLNIAIAEHCRRRGLARRLLEHGLAECRARDATVVHLEVRQSNSAAIRLYEHFGFETVGYRKDYYPLKKGREAARLMLCKL